MNFFTPSIGHAAAFAQQLSTTFPGTPVSILQRQASPPRWEVIVGPEATCCAVVDLAPVYFWPTGERLALVASAVAAAMRVAATL